MEALRDVHDYDSARDGGGEGGHESERDVACAEGFEDRAADGGGGEDCGYERGRDSRVDFEDDDGAGVERSREGGRGSLGFLGFGEGRGVRVLQVVPVHDDSRLGDGGQGSGVGGFEAGVAGCGDLGDARAAKQFVAEVDAYLRDFQMGGQNDGAEEVVGAI